MRWFFSSIFFRIKNIIRASHDYNKCSLFLKVSENKVYNGYYNRGYTHVAHSGANNLKWNKSKVGYIGTHCAKGGSCI